MNAQQEVTRIAIIGSGTLGSQIAFTMAAFGGHRVSLFDNNPSAIEFAKAQMSKWLSAMLHENRPCSTESALNELLTAADSLETAVRNTDLVIEAVPENLDLKRDLFSAISKLTDTAILATNSSSLKSRQLADATQRPGRLLNLHFFLEPWETKCCGADDLW